MDIYNESHKENWKKQKLANIIEFEANESHKENWKIIVSLIKLYPGLPNLIKRIESFFSSKTLEAVVWVGIS